MIKSLALALSVILSTTVENPVAYQGPGHQLVDQEIKCLATTLFGEARNQGELGMALVAQSVVNRANSPRFPDSYCAVVEAPRQYDAIDRWPRPRRPEQIEPRSWVNVAWVTFKYLDGQMDPALAEQCPGASGIKFFFNPAKARPYWRHVFPTVCKHQDHVFLAMN